jgi:hypothetical protein
VLAGVARVLSEGPGRPFHPKDDRITSPGLHHHVTSGIGHDLIIGAWRASQPPACQPSRTSCYRTPKRAAGKSLKP